MSEIEKQVERIVGLDYDAFTRSVVLPQGQFDAFLKGEPEERRKILVALLNLQVYKRMQEAANRRAAESIAAFQQDYPAKLQFPYGAPKYERPFLVRSIWHDGRFTYIKSDATELPALYEVKDGKPAVVNFQVREGTYVVPKVLDRGYLALGNQRFTFEQQGR